LKKLQKKAEVDLSLLIVDFKDFDRSRTTPFVADFPNRIVSLKKYPRSIYAYQTVGALNKKFDSNGDLFAIRIVSRERIRLEYVAEHVLFYLGGEHLVHQDF
jgi:hypothetical protein